MAKEKSAGGTHPSTGVTVHVSVIKPSGRYHAGLGRAARRGGAVWALGNVAPAHKALKLSGHPKSYSPRSRLNVDVGASNIPSEAWSKQLEDMIHSMADMALENGLEAARTKLDAMVKVFSNNVPAPRYNMREARMIAKAQEKVIKSTEWVTASDISELAQLQSANKSAGPAKWKAASKIFSVSYLGEELYPIYALDKQGGFRPLAGLKPIIELFDGHKDSWGMAYWFAGANGYLGGQRPQDVLAVDCGRVLKAAADEIAGITHG